MRPNAATPAMTDDAVRAKTGRAWAEWFALLDAQGAAKFEHKAIVAALSGDFGVPDWWRQMIAVEYERARGLRARHEKADGFSVSVSKTFPVPLGRLYAAATDGAARGAWFPEGAFAPSSQTPDKYLRGAWNGSARLEIGFLAKGEAKAQISVQVGKLAAVADVERERGEWKAALERLWAALRA